MIYANLARGAKVAQACLFQMAAAALQDGRRFGVTLDEIDEIRNRVAPTRRTFEGFARAGRPELPLPRINLLTNIRCPHQRVCNLLRQMLQRLERIVNSFDPADAGFWLLIDTQAALQGAFDQLNAALQATPETPPNAVTTPPAWNGKTGITVADIAKQYLQALAVRVAAGSYGAHSFSHVQRDLRLFEDAYGAKPVNELRQSNLTKFLEENPTWKSAWTIKRAVTSILGAFRWAAEEEIVPICPFRSPSILRGAPRRIRRPVERHEYIALMKFGSRALRRALFFLRHTGCRTCELREVRWEDCRLDGPDAFIELQKHKTFYKTGRSRKIGLDVQTVRFLRNLKRQSSGEGHVFLTKSGVPWDRHNFARCLRRCAKRIGLDEGVQHRVSAYGLRHAYACDAIEAGVSAKMVADQLGQSDSRMVETIYASHTRDREKHLGNVAGIIAKARKKKPDQGEDTKGESA